MDTDTSTWVRYRRGVRSARASSAPWASPSSTLSVMLASSGHMLASAGSDTACDTLPSVRAGVKTKKHICASTWQPSAPSTPCEAGSSGIRGCRVRAAILPQ